MSRETEIKTIMYEVIKDTIDDDLRHGVPYSTIKTLSAICSEKIYNHIWEYLKEEE